MSDEPKTVAFLRDAQFTEAVSILQQMVDAGHTILCSHYIEGLPPDDEGCTHRQVLTELDPRALQLTSRCGSIKKPPLPRTERAADNLCDNGLSAGSISSARGNFMRL